MFVLRRLSAVWQSVTLGCAALLLIVMSASSRQVAEASSGLAVQSLCQAIGLRSPSLRRPPNAPLRGSTVRKAIADEGPSSTAELDHLELACLYAYRPLLVVPYRLIVEHRRAAFGAAVALLGLDVPRARAPPVLNA